MLRVCVCSPPSQTNLFQTNLFQTNHHTITHYYIHQITNSLTRVPGLPGDFAATKKLQEWLVTLNGMRAMDAISEEQARVCVGWQGVGWFVFCIPGGGQGDQSVA